MFDIDPFAFSFFVFCAVVAATLLGLMAALVGWGGARAGMIVGVLVGVAGVANLVLVLLSPWPWLWWTSVVPLYAGWLAVATWRRRRGDVHRLPFRFGLRAWMLFLLAVCLLMGGITSLVTGYRAEQRVVASFDPQRINVFRSTFGHVSGVVVMPEDEQDLIAALDQLKQLRALRSLQVSYYSGPLSHSTLEQIAELGSLDELSMQHLRPADADLEPIGRLRRLRVLELDGADLTDAGLVHLYPLKRLQRLYLYDRDPQKITPQGIQRLRANLPALEPGKP